MQIETFMLMDIYQKTINTILQWLDVTAATIISYRRPVRIPIKQPANLQQYGVNRKNRFKR
jgi:hypothetical protein